MIVLKKEDCYCDMVKFYEHVAKKLGIEAAQFNCAKIRVSEPVRKAIWDYYKDTAGIDDTSIAMLWVSMGPKADLNESEYCAEVEDGFAVVGSFTLGEMVMTYRMSDRMNKDSDFGHFVSKSLAKYMIADWGEMCDEDKRLNNRALFKGGRLHGVYISPETGETIWIITEADRHVTTILFPEEY